MVELWGKGHSPNIEDPELQDAVKTYNMMDSGFTVKTDELSKYETELVNLIKNSMNKKQMQNQKQMQQRLKQ